MNKKKDYKYIFAQRLNDLIVDSGVTAQEIADSINTTADSTSITAASISYWRHGTKEPKLSNIVALANYFGVSADYLLGLSDSECRISNLLTPEEKNAIFFTSYVGLSSKSIVNLHKIKHDFTLIRFVDYLLSNKSYIESIRHACCCRYPVVHFKGIKDGYDKYLIDMPNTREAIDLITRLKQMSPEYIAYHFNQQSSDNEMYLEDAAFFEKCMRYRIGREIISEAVFSASD